MSVDIFKECDSFIDEKLLQELGQDLEQCGGTDDDLQKLFDSVDIEASISTDDLLGNLPDDLEIPMFGSAVQDVFREDAWKDASDGSDSGIDCLSIKHEPLSPASSHCSDFSNDSHNSQTTLMDYSPSLAQFSEHSETSTDLFSQFDLDSLGGTTDPNFFTAADVKMELPDTPPLTPHLTQETALLTGTMPSVAAGNNVKCINTSVNSVNSINGQTARAITFVTNNGGSKNTVTVNAVNKSTGGGPIKVVLPVSHTQNGRIKKLVNTSKVKIQPRPLQQITSTAATSGGQSMVKATKIHSNTLPQGKPLVLTPEEFAKLTAQGVLKLESSSGAQSTPAQPETTTKLTIPTSNTHQPSATIAATNATALTASNHPSATNLGHRAMSGVSTFAENNKTLPLPAGFPVTSGCGPVTDLDLKSWKRQQRMIKNRESACLSRKRKKEYLGTIEVRLQESTHQNDRLKSENHQLKRKLEQLAKENEALRRGRMGVGSVKKAAVSLLAIALFFTLNLSPLTSIFNTSDGQQSLHSPLGALSPSPSSSHHSSRHLLSLDDSSAPNTNPTLLDGMIDMSKSRYNINDIEATVKAWQKSVEFHGLTAGGVNNKAAASGDVILMKEMEKLKVTLSTMCPMYYNSTESKRLMNEISGWFLGQNEEMKRKELGKHEREEGQQRARKAKKVYHPKKVTTNEIDSYSTEYSDTSGHPYELQLFTGPDNRYEKFMDAIHRRNDTFYVVSFRRDQIFLPATATNNSMGRPRMSLVMPAMGLNETMQASPGNIAMMQIDCEVMATNVLHIEKNAVPDKTMDNATFFVPPPSPAETQEVPPPGVRKNRQSTTQRASKKGHLPRERNQAGN